jgi:hypothetical protein
MWTAPIGAASAKQQRSHHDAWLDAQGVAK